MKEIVCSSSVGMDTGKPVVSIEVPGAEMLQLDSTDARAFALNILGCAEAAEQDLFFYRSVTEKLGFTHDAAVQLLRMMRELRSKAERI